MFVSKVGVWAYFGPRDRGEQRGHWNYTARVSVYGIDDPPLVTIEAKHPDGDLELIFNSKDFKKLLEKGKKALEDTKGPKQKEKQHVA